MLVSEIFYSLEGEGQWVGYPTVFIRLSGCNLDCSWCDTDHEKNTDLDLSEILNRVGEYNCPRVKVTGGEPLIHTGTSLLIKALKDNGYMVALETNGTLYDYPSFMRSDLICMDIKTPSSREESKLDVISRTLHEFPDKVEFKMVVSTLEDLEYCQRYSLLTDKLVIMPDTTKPLDLDLVKEMKYKLPICRYGLRLQEILSIR